MSSRPGIYGSEIAVENLTAIAITPDGRSTYAASARPGLVIPISLATGILRSPIAVGKWPTAIAITPDGTTAYVTNSGDGTVTPVDLATATLAAPITHRPALATVSSRRKARARRLAPGRASEAIPPWAPSDCGK